MAHADLEKTRKEMGLPSIDDIDEKISAFSAENVSQISSFTYFKFVRLVALSPLLPLGLYFLISISCSNLGTGLGFACTHPGYGKTFWLEIFAYYGILGWIPSLLIAAVLALLGKMVGLAVRRNG